MPFYNIKFYEQLIEAKDLDHLVDKINKHSDSIPFRIFQDGEEITQWRKYRGLEKMATAGGSK